MSVLGRNDFIGSYVTEHYAGWEEDIIVFDILQGETAGFKIEHSKYNLNYLGEITT